MSHAEKCPVCHGQGKLPVEAIRGPWGKEQKTTTLVPCHGCHGCGWVTVHDPRHLLFPPILPKKKRRPDYRTAFSRN